VTSEVGKVHTLTPPLATATIDGPRKSHKGNRFEVKGIKVRALRHFRNGANPKSPDYLELAPLPLLSGSIARIINLARDAVCTLADKVSAETEM
jgi:hypothetical protein